MRFPITKSLILLLAFSCAQLFFVANAQEFKAGKLAEISDGHISLSLEITNRPNPTILLITKNGGKASIPAFLEERLSQNLNGERTIKFPICLAGSANREYTVSVETRNADEQFLTSTNGSKIPFDVSIKGNSASGINNRKAQYKPGNGTECNETSALEVEINIPLSSKIASSESLRGKFKLMITSE